MSRAPIVSRSRSPDGRPVRPAGHRPRHRRGRPGGGRHRPVRLDPVRLDQAGAVRGAAPASVIRPGHWAQVTTPLPNNPLIPEIGLARGADGVLHVLWTTGSGPWHVKDTPIAANGKVGKSTTLRPTSWPPILTSPRPRPGSSPSGTASSRTRPNSPQGTFTATGRRRAAHGRHPGRPSRRSTAVPDTSSPDTATTGSDGQPWFAYSGTDSMVVDHVGHPEVQVAPADKCCFDNAGLAVDGASGRTWLAYSSLIPGGAGHLHPAAVGHRPAVRPGRAAASVAAVERQHHPA